MFGSSNQSEPESVALLLGRDEQTGKGQAVNSPVVTESASISVSPNKFSERPGVDIPTDSGEMLAWALFYASQGWQVFPVYGIEDGRCTCRKGADCDHPGKHPISLHGFKDATT